MVKIAPETAIKLTFNDRIKHLVCKDPEHITPLQRLFAGAVSGAVAQVQPLLDSDQRCLQLWLQRLVIISAHFDTLTEFSITGL